LGNEAKSRYEVTGKMFEISVGGQVLEKREKRKGPPWWD